MNPLGGCVESLQRKLDDARETNAKLMRQLLDARQVIRDVESAASLCARHWYDLGDVRILITGIEVQTRVYLNKELS